MPKFIMKKNMNFTKVKSIKTVILISILPVVLISLVIMGIFSSYTSKKLITTEIENRMKHQLQETINIINKVISPKGYWKFRTSGCNLRGTYSKR